MRKKLLALLMFFGGAACAQSIATDVPSVEKSVLGLQTGFLGIWSNGEFRLTNTIALRAEVGFDAAIWGGSLYDNTGFLLAPVITAEPRLYYNLKKRLGKGRSIAGNSGNFVSLKTGLHPNWFVISNQENVTVVSDISIIPSWGIRRHIGAHFNYEAGAGLGYRYIFAKSAGYAKNESEAAVNLNLRIGYTF